MAQGAKTVLGRRLAGIVYLVVVISLILLSIAIYDKKFTPVVLVKLKADHTGNSLQANSDVKELGIIVGSVRSVKVDSGPNGGCPTDQVTCVTVTLALDPSRVKIIPSNVSAQILPKTIFGEQYVSLEIPPNEVPGGAGVEHIAKNDVIPQDRTAGALETEKVLGDLLPLLQAVKPAELNATLTAIATALSGRGEELGQTLVSLDKYLNAINPSTKQLVDDLKDLGSVANLFNAAAPDLLATLHNLVLPSQTLISQQNSLSSLLATGISTSDTIDDFLKANKNSLIALTDTSQKTFALLAEYSPEFSCLVDGLSHLATITNTIIQGDQFHLSAVVDNTNLGKYKAGEEPVYLTGFGPHCFGLPDDPQPVVNGKFQIPAQFRCLNDGAALTADACGKTTTKSSSATEASLNTFEGSLGENAVVNVLIAHDYGTTPNKVPYVATMLSAPLLRGAAVTVK
jgi:phospholipid/cholesterol/gamma-HCH transport system substrate-binding protein